MAQTDLFRRESQRALPIWLPIVAAALLLARILVPAHEPKPIAGADDLVEWQPLARASALAQATHKPILYEFSAAWCGPCQRLEQDVFRNPTLAAKINERFVPVRVIDRQQEDGVNAPPVAELESRFAVRAFPTLIIADANGVAATRMEGYRDAEAFERFIEQ